MDEQRRAAPAKDLRARYPRGRGDQLRVDLVGSAARLMAERGSVDGVSLRAVAADVGVSPTAVYRHFDDHRALLIAALEHWWNAFREEVFAAAATGETPAERLHRGGQAYIQFAVDHPGAYRILFSDTPDIGLDEPLGLGAFEELVAYVGEALADQGDRRDPFFVAVQVHTWLHGIVDLCCGHASMTWPPLEDLLVDMGVRLGLRPPPG